MSLSKYKSLEPQGALIPPVEFVNIQPDVLCDLYKNKIMEHGYLKASVSGINNKEDTWDNFYKEEKERKHRRYEIKRLTNDSLVVSLVSTKRKWKRENGSVSIDEAIAKLESIAKGESGSYQVVYAIIEKPGTVKSLRHLLIGSCFDKLKSAMHAAFKEDEWVDGVHTLYVFGGQKKTLFPLHTEDNKFESVSVNMHGEEKWWDVVVPKDSDKLRVACESLKAELQLQTKEVLCADYLQHKKILLSDSFFKKHGISFNRVCQPAGTMMIIGPDVYHQGINLGENIAIAVNFTSTIWLSSIFESRRFLIDNQCNCALISAPFDADKLEFIAKIHLLCKRHFEAYGNLKQAQYTEDAEEKANNKKRKPSSEPTFPCPFCKQMFVKKSNVRRHVDTQHVDNRAREQLLCSTCNITFSTRGNLKKHLAKSNCQQNSNN